jgi:hypothetical protein
MPASIGIAFSPRIKRATGAVRAALRVTLDLALPPLCPACREPVEGRGLCPACWSKLSFITRPYCERLGIPFVYDPGPGILSWKRLPTRQLTIAPAPPCASTIFRGRWSMPLNMATGSTLHR